MSLLDYFKRQTPKPRKRSFDAANTGRLFSDWLVQTKTADSDLRYALKAMRARSRDLCQNNEKFIPKIIQSIKDDKEVPVYGDGTQVREWIHAYDNVKRIYTLLVSDEVNEIYNIGSGERYQNIEIIKMIGEILGKDVKFKYVKDRLGHDKRYSLNSWKYIEKFHDDDTIKLYSWLKEIIK